jgi:hypothetical protein
MSEFTQEGFRYVLEVVFPETQDVPVEYYIGLAVDADIAEDATLATVTEITGTNYARIAVPSSAIGFPVSGDAGSNDWAVAIQSVLFTGDVAGDWDEAFSMFIATTPDGAGKLVAGGSLATGRKLTNENDTLTVDLTIKLTRPV